MKQYKIKNQNETREFGLKLSSILKAGDVICLNGDLGAGKTTLTKAIAEGLGIVDMVVSPTFTIVHEYHSGRLPLYHFDVYRIGSIEEMEDLGYEEYFYGSGVCVIEWASQVEEILPDDRIEINIRYNADDGEEARIYEIVRGDAYDAFSN